MLVERIRIKWQNQQSYIYNTFNEIQLNGVIGFIFHISKVIFSKC